MIGMLGVHQQRIVDVEHNFLKNFLRLKGVLV